MLLFSINRSQGYENPSLDIIVIEICSTGGCPLEEAREHCFQIQSVISVVILISFQCYCGECSGYIVVILPLLAFYFYVLHTFYIWYITDHKWFSSGIFELCILLLYYFFMDNVLMYLTLSFFQNHLSMKPNETIFVQF
jgi:hypothetical protein